GPALAGRLVLGRPRAGAESVPAAAGTALLPPDPPARRRGRVLGGGGSIGTVWGLGGPPALGLLMELAGPRGALIAGGLIVAGCIGAGHLLRGRRAPAPVLLPAEPGGPAARPALGRAA